MEEEIIGRYAEKKILDDVLNSDKAELVAVFGRRRVGKTYLIKTYLKKDITFEYVGIKKISTKMQMKRFVKKMCEDLNDGIQLKVPNDWFEIFDLLELLLKKKLRRKKVVVFLDEFPWIQTFKSDFLSAFENFWNTWATLQNNLAIVLCGSSASWMIKNIVRNKAGLHNRLTQKISLLPFSLSETALFLKKRKVNLNQYQVTQLYMALGGIPKYLSHIKPSYSATQIIDEACFTKAGWMYDEFTELFYSLFDKPERYIKIIRTLANKPMGLNRTQLIKACKLPTGGSASDFLDELSTSGFITQYLPMGNQLKDGIFKITDEFSLFYLKFMETNRLGENGTWGLLSNTASWKSWSGLAFERICLKHVEAIKQALSIAGIYSETSIWKSKTNDKNGAQIDLVINRNDNCINLCEIKFYENDFSLDKKYATQLEIKKKLFKEETKTNKQLFTTLITTKPFTHNINSIGLIDNVISLDKLFIKITL
jgi:uncharacterized protein